MLLPEDFDVEIWFKIWNLPAYLMTQDMTLTCTMSEPSQAVSESLIFTREGQHLMSIEGNTMTGPAETGGFNYNAWMQLVYGYRSGSGI